MNFGDIVMLNEIVKTIEKKNTTRLPDGDLLHKVEFVNQWSLLKTTTDLPKDFSFLAFHVEKGNGYMQVTLGLMGLVMIVTLLERDDSIHFDPERDSALVSGRNYVRLDLKGNK